jgi:hypothetical protein
MEATQSVAQMRAPGCFGAASVYSMDSTVCGGCPTFEACGEKARETLEAIRGKINVADIMVRHQKARGLIVKPEEPGEALAATPQPTPQPKPITAPVERKTAVSRIHFEVSKDQLHAVARIENSKGREMALILCKNGRIADMRAKLTSGVNPFALGGPSFMRVVCDMLLGGGFTRSSLCAKLMADLTWTNGTASSHVPQACQFLVAFGIAQEINGAFTLMPVAG